MKNKLIKNMIIHIRYPYVAAIIAIMWISISIIINYQKQHIEFLLLSTVFCTLIISIIGFKAKK